MSDDKDLRWGIAKRFEFIEWRAYWMGRVNRKDLEDQFQISTPQASLDFKGYLEAAPGNIEYDSTDKTYVVLDTFKPKFLTPFSAERFLRQLQAVKVGAVELRDTWFASLPQSDVIAPIARAPRPDVLRTVIQAIEARKAVSVDYLSLTRRALRTICPHSLAHDGHRWHVRALDIEKREYRDYVLSRIISVSTRREICNVNPSNDVAWETPVTLRLVPHPKLAPEQKAAMEYDYLMQSGFLEVRTRAALAFYFIRRHDLDLPDMPPERAQLHLENSNDIKAIVEHAGAKSKALLEKIATMVTGEDTPPGQ